MISTVLFINMMFCLFVVVKMNVSKGGTVAKLLWRGWPTVLMFANFMFWLVSIGAIAIV